MLRAILFLLASAALTAGLTCAWTAPAPDAPTALVQDAIQSWTGTLVDAGCKSSSPAQACEVSTNTANFGIMTSNGKFFKFDAEGNSKAKAAIGESRKAGKVTITVAGKLAGDTIYVQDFRLS
jgi:hypothetical protein